MYCPVRRNNAATKVGCLFIVSDNNMKGSLPEYNVDTTVSLPSILYEVVDESETIKLIPTLSKRIALSCAVEGNAATFYPMWLSENPHWVKYHAYLNV